MPLIDMPIEKLREYTGRNPRPSDLDAYWARGLAELDSVPAGVRIDESAFQAPRTECYDLTFTGTANARIHAKLLKPRGLSAAAPAIVAFHGYTGSAGDWAEHLRWTAAGFVVAALDCRGQGGSSEDAGGVKGNTHQGHIIRGLADHEDKLLFRHIFLDTVRLARIVMGLDGVDPDRVGATGASQGGGLTLACAALEPRISVCAPVYPFLSDYQRVWEMDLAAHAYQEIRDYFRRYDPLHDRESETFTRLGYIDVHNLADRITADTLMVTGLMDQVCPPSTQFAAYNRITA
ncbi:MAG: acetylxylan esterase, partial [Spirochaetaceae bacterium]